MNAEGTKRLNLIKSLVEEQGADGDKRWIIDQLVVSEATCQSLREQSSRWEAQALEAGVRIAELEALFALQQTRMAEATHMWQEATGKQDVLPDLGDLLAWLMARPAELEMQVEAAREVLEVADLRGDTDLPHPADDLKPWTARMRTAWEGLRVILARVDKALAEPQECICVNEATSRHCPVHGEPQEGKA